MTSVTQGIVPVLLAGAPGQGYGHYQENHFQNSFQRWLAKKPCFSKARYGLITHPACHLVRLLRLQILILDLL